MIELVGLTKCFGSLTAVDQVSFTVAAGELVALVGPNGAGKTTLARMLLGLIRPTSGSASVDGCDVQRHGLQARSRIGYLPQRAVLYGNLSVLENLLFLADLHHLPITRVAEVLELTNLHGHTDQIARRLSGGFAQRLGLAQALLADPPVLILDEPTAGLDPQSVTTLKTLLLDLRARGKTLLLSSHILNDVQELADRVAILHNGRLVAIDSVTGLAARCGLTDRIEILLARVSGHEPALFTLPGISATLRGTTLNLDVSTAQRPTALQAVLAAGLPIRDIRSSSPRLEQIFLQLIGGV